MQSTVKIIGCLMSMLQITMIGCAECMYDSESGVYNYEPVALTVMVTLTGSLSSTVGGAWPVVVVMGVGLALRGEEVVRGEAARGMGKAGP